MGQAVDFGPTLGGFFEAWELFRDPALAGTIAGGILGLLGVYVVVRRMVFLSAALSQCAGLGVALSFYAQIHWGAAGVLGSPRLGALLVTLVTALLLTAGRGRAAGRRDALLGFAFLVGSAGTLAIATRIVQQAQDIQSLLFGSAVAVLPRDLVFVAVTGAVLLVLHLWWMRGFVQVSIDSDAARVRGLPVRTLEIALLISLALAISFFTQILGALPVFAFSVLPAMAALGVAINVPVALVLAGVGGGISGFLGYVFAFRLELPVGASQTLVAALLVTLAGVVRRGSLLRRA